MDTDVIVAAMRSPSGASAELLRRIRAGQMSLLLSTAMMIEYDAVCTRSQHGEVADLSRDEVRAFLDAIAGLARPVEMHFRWRPQVYDLDDEIVLETAINGNAGWIATFNVKHYGNAASRFGITVARPGGILWRIGQ